MSKRTASRNTRAMTALLLALAAGLSAPAAAAQEQTPSAPARRQGQGEHQPPPRAYEDCRGKKAGDVVQHETREGTVAATCEESPNGLVARPGRKSEPAAGTRDEERSGDAPSRPRSQGDRGRRGYSLEQAVSDPAQLNTIAFDGLAFLTGDFGYDTFLPPGKVSDYFGFQYMRDVDAHEGGHNTSFLTRIAHNVLAILDDPQRAQLAALAAQQERGIRRFAELRLPLIQAFRLNLDGRSPAGSAGLDAQAVIRHSADLYALDGQLSYDRARVMAGVLRSLSARQQAALSKLKFGDSASWPEIAPPIDWRRLSHEAHVAVMTYASEMFSWYAGSLEADTYFCPERHGMYFGGFGMKTAPAMGKRDYSISTTLTGNSGESFLAALTPPQRGQITALLDLQRDDLGQIVVVRRAIAGELRRFLAGETAERARVLSLSRRYGELDGGLSFLYATAFARVGQSLSAQQRQALAALRSFDPSAPRGPFLYSTPVSLSAVAGADAFFIRR